MIESLHETVVYGLVKNNNVLLSRRIDSNDIYYNQDILPAGKVESQDRSSNNHLVTTLLRETSEELGITPTAFNHLFSKTYPINNVLLHFFIITQWTGDITNLEPNKETFTWFNIAEALQIASIPALIDGLNAISLFLSAEQANRQQLLQT